MLAADYSRALQSLRHTHTHPPPRLSIACGETAGQTVKLLTGCVGLRWG